MTVTFDRRMTVVLARSLVTPLGKRVELYGLPIVGEGGEGWIIDMGRYLPNTVLKLFKQPQDYPGSGPVVEAVRSKAALRLKEFPAKFAAFPKLPEHVIAPQELVWYDDQKLAGFTMRHLNHAESFERYLPRGSDEETQPSLNATLKVLMRISQLVAEVHKANVVIGDFKPANILVQDDQPYLIDAESMQYAGFACQGFTQEYVDPKICTLGPEGLVAVRPFSEGTDWYAFAAMVMEAVLCISPFGGTYLPVSGNAIQQEERPIAGITVFHDEVVRPRSARPFTVLPPLLFEYLRKLFVNGERAAPHATLFTDVSWKECHACGTQHLRESCPNCRTPHVELRALDIKMLSKTHQGVLLSSKATGAEVQLVVHRGNSLWVGDDERITDVPRSDIEFAAHQRGNVIAVLQERFFDLGSANRLPSFLGVLPKRSSSLRRWFRSAEEIWWTDEDMLLRSPYHSQKISRVLPEDRLFGTSEGMNLARLVNPRTVRIKLYLDDGSTQESFIKVPEQSGALLWATGAVGEHSKWLILSFSGALTEKTYVYAFRKDGSMLGTSTSGQPGGPGNTLAPGTCQVVTVLGSKNREVLLWGQPDRILAADPQAGALSWGKIHSTSGLFYSAGNRSRASFFCVEKDTTHELILTIQMP